MPNAFDTHLIILDSVSYAAILREFQKKIQKNGNDYCENNARLCCRKHSRVAVWIPAKHIEVHKQVPIVCYRSRKHFSVDAGSFSLHSACIAARVVSSLHLISQVDPSNLAQKMQHSVLCR